MSELHPFTDAETILRETKVLDRFLSYVKVDTRSDEESETCPSTEKQWVLARQLEAELKEMGLSEVELDENGYVLATLPGRRPGALGLIAHYDTAPAFNGADVNPRFHENYDGGVIEIGEGLVLDPEDNPDLLECLGDTIITTDGKSLLGADDKAGIAAIMAALEVLLREKDLDIPTLRICFNPDEEIGRGAHRFPLDKFDVPAAFTVDGGFPGEMNVETFSADGASVTFTGVAVHPGEAKGKMVNALTYLGKFLSRLPMAETPECTEGREGFIHPTGVRGDAAECRVDMILRDFDDDVLAERGRRVTAIAEGLRAEEPKLGVKVEIREQYRNMANGLQSHPEIRDTLSAAIAAAGLSPRIEPIRGGTDGSQLTAKGLPTPNLFAGGVNFHGPQEWIARRALGMSTCTLLNLVQLWRAPVAV